MVYEVRLDEFVLQCEVTYLEDVPPTPGIDTSDWDAYGYREMEFQVISGQICDEEGVAIDAGRNACAALAEKYAEFIEQELWRQIEKERQDVA
ncbi:hypothetical protein DKB71_33035 (plasmid) [Pseudomonas sp. PLMAX]